MATHSSILAQGTPWTEEPGGLQSRVAKSQDMTEHACTALHNAKAYSLCLVGRQKIFFDWLVVSLSKI